MIVSVARGTLAYQIRLPKNPNPNCGCCATIMVGGLACLLAILRFCRCFGSGFLRPGSFISEGASCAKARARPPSAQLQQPLPTPSHRLRCSQSGSERWSADHSRCLSLGAAGVCGTPRAHNQEQREQCSADVQKNSAPTTFAVLPPATTRLYSQPAPIWLVPARPARFNQNLSLLCEPSFRRPLRRSWHPATGHAPAVTLTKPAWIRRKVMRLLLLLLRGLGVASCAPAR